MSVVIQDDLLSLCFSQSCGAGSTRRLEDSLNKIMAIQETISVMEGGEPSLLDVLDRLIGLYERFVPVGAHAKGLRLKIDDRMRP
jgi:hypothetical protein